MLLCRSTKHSKPDVSIVRCKHTGYWLVNITCKDRNKLLFDTVSPLPAPSVIIRPDILLCTYAPFASLPEQSLRR